MRSPSSPVLIKIPELPEKLQYSTANDPLSALKTLAKYSSKRYRDSEKIILSKAGLLVTGYPAGALISLHNV
jgi:hypothetical protein